MINIIVLTGRLTADPILKTTLSGKNVTTFSLAVQRDYPKDITDFITVVAWGGTADFITKYFKKGDMMAVVGSLQSRRYTDKNGVERITYEVVTNNVSFCGGKKKSEETEEKDWQNYMSDVRGFSTATSADFEEVYDEMTEGWGEENE